MERPALRDGLGAVSVRDEREAPHDQQEQTTAGRGRFWLALLVLLSICAVAVWNSALFRLKELEVSGTNRLTEARIMEAAGLVPGAVRWQHSVSSVEKRLLAEPWIKSAAAQWETGRLSIAVEERAPVGLLRHSDLYYLALDPEGIVLEQVNLLEGHGLPVISGITVTPSLRGDRLEQPALRDALDVLAMLDGFFREQISEVHVREDRSLTLFMRGGTTVLWGDVPDGRDRAFIIREKAETLGDFWGRLPVAKRSQCRFDMRVVPRAPAAAAGCE